MWQFGIWTLIFTTAQFVVKDNKTDLSFDKNLEQL